MSNKKIYICYDFETKNQIFYFEEKSLFPQALYEKNDSYEKLISKEKIKKLIEESVMPVISRKIDETIINIIPVYNKKTCEILKETQSIEANNKRLIDNDLFSILNYEMNAKYNMIERTKKRK